ncbi:MAG TPA: acetyl-CoA carboxylase, carboxyltransferase subunit beta [Nitrospirota bacterium]
MAWFKKVKAPKAQLPEKKVKIPEGLWIKCDNCKEIIYKKEIERNLKVCPKCDYHFRITARERLELVIDEGSFVELDESLAPMDFLEFKDTAKYKDRLKSVQTITGQKDAVISGEAEIAGHPVVLAIMDFGFMGGSMGSVVGEKVTRAAERAAEKKSPLIVFSSSGGARMQEGIVSLMQMAKTSAALGRLTEAGMPYISVLTDPTFGGVSASFSSLGDIIIAEPRSLIGFAGPRVIEQTIKKQLPEGFQRAEFQLEHGQVDMIVDRKQMKETLARILEFFLP